MSRHNRRRTRERSSKNPAHSNQYLSYEVPLPGTTPVGLGCLPSFPPRLAGRRNDLSARHWHNRYVAWQNRERRQREEWERLAAEQQRIFGGEKGEGDEDGLCSNMMEYFVKLDFIMS